MKHKKIIITRSRPKSGRPRFYYGIGLVDGRLKLVTPFFPNIEQLKRYLRREKPSAKIYENWNEFYRAIGVKEISKR